MSLWRYSFSLQSLRSIALFIGTWDIKVNASTKNAMSIVFKTSAVVLPIGMCVACSTDTVQRVPVAYLVAYNFLSMYCASKDLEVKANRPCSGYLLDHWIPSSCHSAAEVSSKSKFFHAVFPKINHHVDFARRKDDVKCGHNADHDRDRQVAHCPIQYHHDLSLVSFCHSVEGFH